MKLRLFTFDRRMCGQSVMSRMYRKTQVRSTQGIRNETYQISCNMIDCGISNHLLHAPPERALGLPDLIRC